MDRSLIGTRYDHYRVLEFLARGFLSDLYRARDEKLERDVVLRVLGSRILADEAERNRFNHEANTLLRLNHPNLSTLLDFGTVGDANYLVFEYLPVNTLPERLNEGGFPEEEVSRLGVQLAEGLAFVHAAGLVYQGLKPGNLVLLPDGQLKILLNMGELLRSVSDFDATSSPSEAQFGSGSPPYMSPEQLLEGRIDARSNIYSAGAVLYELATGHRPFTGTDFPRLVEAILNRTPAPPREIQRRLSRALERLLLKALEKDPDLRYQSARELKSDLEHLVPLDTRRTPRPGAASRLGRAILAAATRGRGHSRS